MPAYVFGSTKPPSNAPSGRDLTAADTATVEDNRTALPFRMLPLVAEGMRALHFVMAYNRGVQLTTTGRIRTYAQQRNGFYERWSTIRQPNYYTYVNGVRTPRYVTASYEGKLWYLKLGQARIAVPSWSAPHVKGVADDLAEIVDGKVLPALRTSTLDALIQEAPGCGFKWSKTTTTPIEPWHLQWVMGDEVPPVVAWLRAQSANPTPPPVDQHEGRPAIGVGSKGALVTALQLIIQKVSDASITVDSQFGQQTLVAWQNLCRYCGWHVDGDVSGKDWDLLAWVDGTWDRLLFCGFPPDAV